MVNEDNEKGAPQRPFAGIPDRNGQPSAGVLLAELVDAAAGVDDLLLARIERMAVRADFDLQVVTEGRARMEGVPAAAGHRDLFVFGMDCVFHGLPTPVRRLGEKGAQCSDASRPSQEKIR
jgi:hypothetical protein